MRLLLALALAMGLLAAPAAARDNAARDLTRAGIPGAAINVALDKALCS